MKFIYFAILAITTFFTPLNLTIAQSSSPNNTWLASKYIGYNNGIPSGNLYFKTNGATRASITSGLGYFGIGIQQPIYRLHVDGDLFVTGTGINNAPGTASLLFGDNNNQPEFGIEYNGGGLNFWKPFGSSNGNNGNGFRNNLLFVKDDGNIGIGTSNPTQTLEVAHDDATGGIAINQVGTMSKKSEIKFNYQGNEEWAIGSHLDPSGINSFFIWSHLGNRTALYISENGKVNIGGLTIPPQSSQYMLFVDGGIATRDIKVTNSTIWPDFVFSKSYILAPLHEVEEYILKHNHLPGIQSSEEIISNNGYEIGDMQNKLLMKIEEQTLYIISLQKQIDKIKNELILLNNNK